MITVRHAVRRGALYNSSLRCIIMLLTYGTYRTAQPRKILQGPRHNASGRHLALYNYDAAYGTYGAVYAAAKSPIDILDRCRASRGSKPGGVLSMQYNYTIIIEIIALNMFYHIKFNDEFTKYKPDND